MVIWIVGMFVMWIAMYFNFKVAIQVLKEENYSSSHIKSEIEENLVAGILWSLIPMVNLVMAFVVSVRTFTLYKTRSTKAETLGIVLEYLTKKIAKHFKID